MPEKEHIPNENIKISASPATTSDEDTVEQVPGTDSNNAATTELQTINPARMNHSDGYKPQTNSMEVHHHPRVETRSFKEYLLEGVMIFLAVTLGFFAESIRERISERGKEKEYIINIKKDLVADTANLRIWIPSVFNKIHDFDSLISFLQSPGNTNRGSDMYYYARFSTRSRTFEASNNTIIELKNSGNFRLISNQKVLNSLTGFQKIIDNYINLSAIDVKEAELSYPLLGNLFDASVFNSMVKLDERGSVFTSDANIGMSGMSNIEKPAGNPQLRNRNQDTINLLIFYIHERKSSFIGELRLLLEQKKEAIALIELINKEYHLQDEQ